MIGVWFLRGGKEGRKSGEEDWTLGIGLGGVS